MDGWPVELLLTQLTQRFHRMTADDNQQPTRQGPLWHTPQPAQSHGQQPDRAVHENVDMLALLNCTALPSKVRHTPRAVQQQRALSQCIANAAVVPCASATHAFLRAQGSGSTQSQPLWPSSPGPALPAALSCSYLLHQQPLAQLATGGPSFSAAHCWP